MTDINDFQGFEQRYHNQLARLDTDNIDTRDHDAIKRFIARKDSSIKTSSLGEYLKTLRMCAIRSDTPLVEMDADDVRTFASDLRHNPDYGRNGTLAETTVVNHLETLRLLLADHGVDWPSDLGLKAPKSTVDPSDMFTAEDIEQLTTAADNLRDIAAIEFLADTGARLSLVGSLRLKDLNLDGDTATYMPNSNARGLKGAEIAPYPIIDSRAALRTYIRSTHPRPDTPEAAVFHRRHERGIPFKEDGGALSSTHLSHQIREAGKKANINKPVNPHNFRHSAITRMWREGYTKQQIQHRVHWRLDTDMWDRYVHLAAEDMNNSIFADVGVTDGDGQSSMTRRTCGTCRETLSPSHRHCPQCGTPATPVARQDMNRFRQDLFDRAIDEPNEEIVALLRDLNAALDSDPKTRKLVSKALSD